MVKKTEKHKKNGNIGAKRRKGYSTKRTVIGIFYILAVLLATVVLLHHNPLADQTTEMMKKVMACLLIAFTCVICRFLSWNDLGICTACGDGGDVLDRV